MTAHDCISKVIMIYRDCVNAEIVHFYTKKNVKNCSIKILMRPRTQDVDLKNSLHIHIVVAILNLTTQRGLETIYISGKLE